MMDTPIYVTDLVGTLVDRVSTILTPSLQVINPRMTGVHYMYGHPTEIAQRLTMLSKGDTTKFDKYPLVWLNTPFVKQVDKKVQGFSTVTLEMFIINGSEANLISPQRYEKNIKPILKPIEYELINQFSVYSVGLYKPFDTSELTYDEIDYDYWGKTVADSNSLLDFLDCVALKNFKVKLNIKNC
jgi:hypothetical protein